MAESPLKPAIPGLILLLVLVALVFYGQWKFEADLADLAIYSGWTLLALSLLLAIYNLRKKVSTLPLGRTWYWRRGHSFMGWLAAAIFFIHAGPLPPDGMLNLLLWLLYVLVLLSGILGLWFSLALPPRIASGGERLQFERIPQLREALNRYTEQAVLAASSNSLGQPLSEFHNLYLRPYLSRPWESFRHIFKAAKYAAYLQRELNDIGRYVDSDSRHYITQLEEVIGQKNNLDRQYALQYLLKKWTYVHVALNYMSWAFIIMHVLVIYTFRLEYGL